jgi:hypothetical protein
VIFRNFQKEVLGFLLGGFQFGVLQFSKPPQLQWRGSAFSAHLKKSLEYSHQGECPNNFLLEKNLSFIIEKIFSKTNPKTNNPK